MSAPDPLQRIDDARRATREEPLLREEAGNERRGRLLARIAAELGKGGDKERALVLGLVASMRPNSTADSWDTLYLELASVGEGGLAEDVAGECRKARLEIWQGMRTDRDLISQVAPMNDQFVSAYAAGLNNFRYKLGTMSNYMKKSFVPGPEMESHVVDMARFGSTADDWAVRTLIEELYLERGLYEQACGICERLLAFKGYDKSRMAASTLVEDILNALLGHLKMCEEPEHVDRLAEQGLPISPRCRDGDYLDALKERCLDLLVRRAKGLGLGIRPDRHDFRLASRVSNFAQRVAARKKMPAAKEIASHVHARYPLSWKFLGLSRQLVLKRMVELQGPLVQSISIQIDLERSLESRDVEYDIDSALDILESRLKFQKRRGVAIDPRTERRWKRDIRGTNLWGSLFEMDVYFRLVRVKASVMTDVALPAAGRGLAKNRVARRIVADLKVNGCLAELHSPPSREILVDGRPAPIDTPAALLVERMLKKALLNYVGNNKVVILVNCTAGELDDARRNREELEQQLEKAEQPGAVLFCFNHDERYEVEILANKSAAAAIPKRAMRAMREALELEMY